MATVQEAVRRLRIESTSRGVSETTDKLKALHQAQEGVIVTSREKERATQSMERRLQSIQKQYDANYRAERALANVERDLKTAVDQGLISIGRKNELMALAAQRHGAAATAATAHRTALTGLATQMGMVKGLMGGMLLGGVAGIVGGALGALTGGQFISASVEQEKSLAQLDAVIRSTGGAAGYTSRELATMASELQAVTSYGDEAVMSSQAMLLTFTRIGRDVFPKAQETILNVATAMNQDLKSSTVQIGKALNDPVAGLTALARVGIQFTKEQKEQIKGHVETGRVIDAQRVILAELEVQFGGSARAARDTLGGALAALKNAFGDLFEVSGGGAEDLRSQIERVVSLLSDPRTQAAVQGFGSFLLAEFGAAVKAARDAYLEISYIVNELKNARFSNVLPYAYGDGAERRLADRSLRIGIGSQLTEADASRFYDVTGRRLPQPSGGPRGGSPLGEPDAEEKKRDQFDRATESIRKQTLALEVQAKTFGMGTVEAARFRIEQELLGAAEAAKIERTPELLAKIDQAVNKYAEATAQVERLRQAQESLNQVRTLTQGFFTDMVSGFRQGETASESFRKAIDRLIGKLGDLAIDRAFDLVFGNSRGQGGIFSAASLAGGGKGGLLGGILIPGILHSGGVVGLPGMSRGVPSNIFVGANRFATGGIAGIGPDEVPIIAHRNEEVIRRDDPRHRWNGGGEAQTLTVRVIVNDEKFSAYVEDGAGRVVARSTPEIVGAAVAQSNVQAPGAVGRYQNERGGEYRV